VAEEVLTVKHFILAFAVCVLALGAMRAAAHPIAAKSERTSKPRPAVWMQIRFPRGRTRMAIVYDKTMATALQQASAKRRDISGWGFRPVIQEDGRVNVKVYRMRFTEKGNAYKPKGRPTYLETLAPRPVARTTQSADSGIEVKIMGTGSAKKLERRLRELKHIAQWKP
jgi:hypothetical protein